MWTSQHPLACLKAGALEVGPLQGFLCMGWFQEELMGNQLGERELGAKGKLPSNGGISGQDTLGGLQGSLEGEVHLPWVHRSWTSTPLHPALAG